MKATFKIIPLILFMILVSSAGLAAVPGEHMNYQGVLRDAAGNPLDGSYDVTLRLIDGEGGGLILWEEEHFSTGTGQVVVTGGLFNVALGTGVRNQNSSVPTLKDAFTYPEVWLEVRIGAEWLSPRTRVRGAGYALNAAQVDGWTADQFLNTSSTEQTKQGALIVESSQASTYGVEGRGPWGGGWFRDSDSTGQAKVGVGDQGIVAQGSLSGGRFEDTDSGIWSRVAGGANGLYTNGNVEVLGSMQADGNLTVGGSTTLSDLSINQTNLYLNQDGPESDSSIFFYDGGSPTGASLLWSYANNRFELSHALHVPDYIYSTKFYDYDDSSFYLDPAGTLSGISGMLAGHLYIGHGSDTDDDLLKFDQGNETLLWNNSRARFEFTDELALEGPLHVGSRGSAPVAYNRFGTGTPAWVDVQSSSDLFVTDDLELGGELALSKVIRMEALETAGADGDQAIYFYDSDSPTSSYIQWDDVSAITCGSIGSVLSGFRWNIGDNTDSGWTFSNGSDAEAVIDELGNMEIDGSLYNGGSCDLAETFFGPSGLDAGTVVVLDPLRQEGVKESNQPLDPTVAGVVTTRPGVLLSGPSADAYPVWEELEKVKETLAALPPAPLHEGTTESGEIVSLDDGTDELQLRRQGLEQRAAQLESELDSWERGNVAVALVGRVPVKADASFGPIRKGDFLTTSATPGRARVLDGPGPYLGIAMDDLDSGQGTVLVFLEKGWYGGAVTPDGEEMQDEPASVIAEVQEMESGLKIVLDRDRNDRATFSVTKDGGNGLASEVFRVDEQGNVFATGSFRPAAMDLAEFHPVSEPVEPGDVLVVDREQAGRMALGRSAADPAVIGIVSTEPGVLLGSGLQRIVDADADLAVALEVARAAGDAVEEGRLWAEAEARFRQGHAAIALSGTVPCKVDAGYGSIEVGDLLTVSPTAGHAMRAADPAPQGTVLGKALEPLDAGTGTIQVLVMMR